MLFLQLVFLAQSVWFLPANWNTFPILVGGISQRCDDKIGYPGRRYLWAKGPSHRRIPQVRSFKGGMNWQMVQELLTPVLGVIFSLLWPCEYSYCAEVVVNSWSAFMLWQKLRQFWLSILRIFLRSKVKLIPAADDSTSFFSFWWIQIACWTFQLCQSRDQQSGGT